MLDAEEARVRLEATADPGWLEVAGARAGALPEPLRPVGVAFLHPDTYQSDDDEQAARDAALRQAAIALDEMTDDERVAVLTALHPELGADLAAWWVAGRAAPYTVGWYRRAFRAPHSPATTRSVRRQHLHHALHRLGPHRWDATWLAAWAAFVAPASYGVSHFTQTLAGPLLAAAIDREAAAGERAVLDELLAVAAGGHPIGPMGRHVVVGLLRSGREEAWAAVERLLLAAQREEGLRQVILEAADEGHPGAFARLLDTVLDHDLLRFAAAQRAAGVWLGFAPNLEVPDGAAAHLRRLRGHLADPAGRPAAVTSGEPWEAYTALVATALGDVFAALDLAEQGLARPDAGARAATVRFLGAAGVCPSHDLLLGRLDDEDLAVAALAAEQLPAWDEAPEAHPDAFEAYERLITRLPERAGGVDGVGIEETPVALDRSLVAHRMLRVLGDRPVGRILVWLPAMKPYTRTALATRAGSRLVLDADLRAALVTLVGDRSPEVRREAVGAMGRLVLAPDEALALEPLLTRRAGDLRRGVIALLARQPTAEVVRSAERLWAWGGDGPRDAACELLGTASPPPPEVVAAASALLADGPTDRQREALGPVAGVAPAVEVGPGLGLHDPDGRTPPTTPQPAPAGTVFATDGSRRLVGALDDLVEQHRDIPIVLTGFGDRTERLLADVMHLPHPAMAPLDAPDGGLVLAEIFRPWWEGRPAELRDGDDGIDALRALAVLRSSLHGLSGYEREGAAAWMLPLWADAIGGTVGEVRHRAVVGHVLVWAVMTHAHEGLVDECLNALEATLAVIPDERHRAIEDEDARYRDDWRPVVDRHHPWSTVLSWLFRRQPELFGPERVGRWLGLLRWIDTPTPAATRRRPPTIVVATAHELGLATDDDVYDALLHSMSALRDWTRHRRAPFVEAFPRGVALADRLRDRVVEIELRRGDLATPASRPAQRLASVHGAELAVELLHRLGRATLVRGSARGESREAVYSHLLRVSHPAPGDTPVGLAAAAATHRLSDARLVDLAVYAPQWAALVEGAIGWTGLADAVWWYHAHTKDDRWQVGEEVRETWTLLSAERTALGSEDLLAGAVDVGWFTRARTALGAERWAVVHGAAKLASGGNGHTRAKLYADALLGVVDEDQLAPRLAKRQPDAVRALGLLPLPDDPAARHAVALERYRALREIERGAARFGAQRQATERTAVRIGVENLARTAGALDPQRFVWAMEAAEAGALADGPVVATEADVTVTLSVDAEGVPQLAVDRAGKALKTIPAPLRKVPALAALRERRTALTRQAARVRASLEAAMVTRDPFTDADLAALRRHPLVAPLLELVVFVDERGRTLRHHGGRWRAADGAAVRPKGGRRIAHPVDLAAADWPAWQEQLFVDARRQPFKQVFRELYVLTDAEAGDGSRSRRWEGHQVQPRQAMALFGSQGWVGDREGGQVLRVFHADDLVARLGFLGGWGTPAEVELPTLGPVSFTRRGSYVDLPLDQVPAVVFSETMRDLDLVASVAHAGGVDPEASASTVEMRAALVRETARIMRLDNVREVGRHVVVEGGLGEYSIHLGSGTVHRRPGGALCIIPVDAQRRGRIFLPFADDDPKTAEVVAKVLLLARDTQIKDPTILDQLRS